MGENIIKTRVVGVDIGVDKTTFAIIDIRGTVLVKDSFPTTEHPNVNEFVSTLSDHVMQLLEQHGGFNSIRSMGICCPSSNYMTGCIENSANMPWKGVIPLAAMVRDRLGIAVALANNSQCIALGEHNYGSAHGMTNFVIITLGHGMGSCIFANGKMHLGFDGFAGEFGHTNVVEGGRKCSCGHEGCIECYCAERGILQTARELMEQNPETPSLMRNVADLTPLIITGLCEQGDALAIKTYELTGRMLGLGLANYASILNPEAFILTGGIPHAGKWLLEPMQQSFDEHVFPNTRGKTRIVVSILDDSIRSVIGAGALAWRVKEYSLFK